MATGRDWLELWPCCSRTMKSNQPPKYIYINKKKQQRGFGGVECLKHDALLRLRQLAFSGDPILSHFV